MRRFEMKEGTSSKFWEVEVRGKEVVVRFGRIGTDGQRKSKRAASAEAAAKEADKLVREKLGKGYAELGARKPAKKPARAPAKPKAGDDAAIARLWTRIERWFARKHPSLSLNLRPGATDKQIAAAEKALKVTFPADLRASLRIHDGQAGDCRIQWLPVVQQLAPLEAMVRCWKGDRAYYKASDAFDLLDKSKRVRQEFLHPRHIPFAGIPSHWDYARLMLDFVPGAKGTEAQVIARDDIDLLFIAPSFAGLLAQTAKGLEDGSVVVEVF